MEEKENIKDIRRIRKIPCSTKKIRPKERRKEYNTLGFLKDNRGVPKMMMIAEIFDAPCF